MTSSPAPVSERSSTEPESPVLAVQDLGTRIHTPRGDLQAVDGVSFTLARGETLGIVGESGSGKSVLGRTIMGLHTTGPTTTVTGAVTIAGKEVHSLSKSGLRQMWGQDVAMVFQDPMTALNPVKKVGIQVTEGLRRHRRMTRAQARSRAEELLGLVGIPEPRRRFDQYPHELSGGMRQRVVIAIALGNEPALLIADEPTTALDVTVQKQILDLLDHLQDELGMATILISHNLGVVAGRADRVAVMYAGRVVESAQSRRLFDTPHHPYTEALLEAIPVLQQPPHVRLEAIDGAPPNLLDPPPGCRFASRCRYAQQDCGETIPPAVSAATAERSEAEHVFTCLHPVNTGGH